MHFEELIASLEGEYDQEAGFIGQLRAGRFDPDARDRLIEILRSCPTFGDEAVPVRLVRVLWWMPWIVEWQVQRLEPAGKSHREVANAGNAIFSQLERIFGAP